MGSGKTLVLYKTCEELVGRATKAELYWLLINLALQYDLKCV